MTLTIITHHNDAQHNDTQHNDTQHNDTQHDSQHNDTQHNVIQHNDIQHLTLSITGLFTTLNYNGLNIRGSVAFFIVVLSIIHYAGFWRQWNNYLQIYIYVAEDANSDLDPFFRTNVTWNEKCYLALSQNFET